MAKHHYVRDRGMAGLGWIGHVGLGQDESYYGTDDAGNDIYISNSTGAYVDQNGNSITPSGAIYGDSTVASPVVSAASAGTGQTYYGTDSKGNDVWVNSKGQFVNQDGLPVTPVGSISVEGGGTVAVKPGSTGISNLTAGTSIASSALPALLAPGPAPRVAVPTAAPASSLLTASTIIPGVSNLLIIGGGLLAIVALMGKK